MIIFVHLNMIFIILWMVLVGYVTARDMDGLTTYYKSLFDDCNNINNLAAINPETINNPSIYAILADKYNKASSKNIQLELGVFIDLNSLHIDTYELTRILGILLDNSICLLYTSPSPRDTR